jgi:NADPH:quinone reductase-like Zn-dependent oxidoreductase
MILGNDGVGTLDDGTPVVIYPVMGSDDWRDDETLDPGWHIFSERVPGTLSDYVAVPKRNAIPLPSGISALDAAVLGTAWLTAYRALFTKSNLKPGETMLVQGASGGMSTALIQLGRAAGFEVWATSRSPKGRELAEKLGAHRTFSANETLPRKVRAVIDNIGPASWEHSMASVARGGTVVMTGLTTGPEVKLSLLPMLGDQITVCGSIMGTLHDMRCMISLIVSIRIKPEIGQVLPMECCKGGLPSDVGRSDARKNCANPVRHQAPRATLRLDNGDIITTKDSGTFQSSGIHRWRTQADITRSDGGNIHTEGECE